MPSHAPKTSCFVQVFGWEGSDEMSVGKVPCKCHYQQSRAQGPTFYYMKLYDGWMPLISNKRCSERSTTTTDKHCEVQMQIQHFMYVNCRHEKFTSKHWVSRRPSTTAITMLLAWSWECWHTLLIPWTYTILLLFACLGEECTPGTLVQIYRCYQQGCHNITI